MTELAQALSASLLSFVWQGAVVAAMVAGALWLLRRRSANARYLTACCGLALMALIPVADTWASLGAPHRTGLALLAAATAAPAGAPASGLPAPLDMTQSWTLRIWAAGVLLFGLRLALSYGHVARLRRTSQAAEPGILARAAELAARMGLSRPVAVMISRTADCPSVTGWLRPAILMPVAVLAGLDAEQLEAILAHELAHIRRHDYFVNLLQTVVETLLFYHPAVWWLSARIRREREYCCDDLAVRYTNGAVRYARALTVLERLRTGPALTPAANGGSLLERVRRLMGEGLDTAPSRLPAIAAAVVAALCFAGSIHWAHGQSRNTADVLSRAPVYYPESARTKGIEGTVTAEVTLDAAGNVTDARIVSGPAELRKPALASVLDWRFAHAAAGEVRQVPIDFKKDMPSENRAEGTFDFQVYPADEAAMRRRQLAEAEQRLAVAQRDLDEQRNSSTLDRSNAEAAQLRMELETKTRDLQMQRELENQSTASIADRNRSGAQEELELQVQILQTQLAKTQTYLARAELGQQSLTPMPSQEGQLVETQRVLRNLRSELAVLRQSMGSENPQVKEKEIQLQLAERELGDLRSALEMTAVEPGAELTGHRIARIFIRPLDGLSGASRPNVPFALGDTWTAESMAKLEAWAKPLSSNPAYRFSVNQSGDIELTITLR